jgi:hypothetical protein
VFSIKAGLITFIETVTSSVSVRSSALTTTTEFPDRWTRDIFNVLILRQTMKYFRSSFQIRSSIVI